MREPTGRLELNEPHRPQFDWGEYRQHLLSASNELFLLEMLCAEQRQQVPAALQRAHASVRAELRRVEQLLAADR